MTKNPASWSILAAAALIAISCGPHKGSVTPGSVSSFSVVDIVLEGDAMVAWTTMSVLEDSPLTSALLDGFKREMIEKAPTLGTALEATENAPLDQADRIVITGRSLDQNSSLLAVGVSYTEDVDWFDDFVLGFHEDRKDPGILADIDGGARLGVISRDTQVAWGTNVTAAVCAIKLTERVVAYVAAPNAGECKFWAGWVLTRHQGDPTLLSKIEQAPKTPTKDAPLAVYVDGDAVQNMCCTPWGLADKMYGVDEAWLGLDPGSPANIALKVAFSDPGTAQARRDALAGLLDTYTPFIAKLSPGLATMLSSLKLEVQDHWFTASLTIQSEYVQALADLLSTML